jgi:hypothetical protein
MATRRVRKSRQSRKVKRGGIFGIPQFKQDYENVRNCQQYWSQNKNPNRCIDYAKVYNYPGYINKLRGAKVLYKQNGQPVTEYSDGTNDY